MNEEGSEVMNPCKLFQQLINGILVMLFLVGCNTPEATLAPTSVPSTLALTSTPIPTFTPSPTPVPDLFGQVTDAATGKGIAGAKIEVQLAGSKDWRYSTNSTSDGSYSIFDLPAGDYIVRVTAQGYAREYYDNVNPSNEATLVRIPEGDRASNINFDLTAGGSVSGYIYQQDGITPIQGADVWAWPSKYPQDDGFQTVTSADGSYIIDGLSLGNIKITAKASGYAASKYYGNVYGWCNASNVVIFPPDNTSNININLDLAGSISGHIYQRDGITPVANVQLVADSSTGNCEGIGISSNSDGSYVIDGLPPKNYILRIQNPVGLATEFFDGQPSSKTADTIPVIAGQQVTGIDFTLEIGAPIRGRVYDETTGAPMNGIQLVASLVNGWNVAYVSSTSTLPDGSYELWMGTGCYWLGVGGHMNAPGYIPEYWGNHYDVANADQICVTAPTKLSEIDFHLARAGSISGHIYDQDGTTPLAGAGVYAFPISSDHPGAGANTNSDGSYTIQGLPSGKYIIQVTASGHVSQFYNNVTDKASAVEVKVNAPNDTSGIDFALSLSK